MKNIKYYLIGALVFAVAIIAYHFYAASQAEQQIDDAIQEQLADNDTISVQYSSIDVPPFGGSVSIQDLTFIFGNHIERANNLQLEISYFDYLNIYFGGIRYGLDHLDKADIKLANPSYTNRNTRNEIKADTLTVQYSGNVLDGLLSAINVTPFNNDHAIEAYSSNLTISLPKTYLTKLKAEEFTYAGKISTGKRNFWLEGSHQFQMDSLMWTPSETFLNRYSFFIKGFGYTTGVIPFQSAQLQSAPVSQKELLQIESSIKSELALVSASGFLQLHNQPEYSELQDMNISITEFSDSFRNVLGNIERLFSISLPESDDGFTLQIEGTLANPVIKQ